MSLHNIPELILNAIKDDVKKSFYDEFEGSLMPAQLEEVFTQYEYISLNETNYKQLSKEKTTVNNRVDEINNEKTEAKEASKLPDANTSHKDVLSALREELAGTLNTEQTLIQQENRSQPAQINQPVQSNQRIVDQVFRFFRSYNPSSASVCEGDFPRLYSNS